MFNFTTLTVLNDIVKYDLADGRIVPKNANVIVGDTSSPDDTPDLRIGNIRFNAGLIEKIEIKKPTVESLASVTFNMQDILAALGTKSEMTARIALYIGLSMNSQDSFYANDLVYKGKPFYVEFYVKSGDTIDLIARRVEANAKKFNLFVSDKKIIDVSKVATPADADQETAAVGTVTFTAVNGYQQFKKAVLQKFDELATPIDCCATTGAFIDVTTGVPAAYTINATTGAAELVNPAKKMDETGTLVSLGSNEVAISPGLEAFGDYNWIIHNLRLPTAANTGFWSTTKNEMPVVGGTYTQFSIKMVTDRDGIAGGVVGQRATSVTNHVFYVYGNCAKDDSVTTTAADKLYKALYDLIPAGKRATTIVSTADDDLANPFA